MNDITSRKKYIDAVKGFCIILVLFSHAGGIPFIGGGSLHLLCRFILSSLELLILIEKMKP